MNVASLELCKELYELSGWQAYMLWVEKSSTVDKIGTDQWGENIAVMNRAEANTWVGHRCPAYDLGYLLRKMPENMRVEFYKRVPNDDCSCSWGIEVGDIGGNTWYVEDDDTPEDAAAKLSIELFKQGILPREDKNEQI